MNETIRRLVTVDLRVWDDDECRTCRLVRLVRLSLRHVQEEAISFLIKNALRINGCTGFVSPVV